MMTCRWLMISIFVTTLTDAGNFNQSSIFAGLSVALAEYYNSVCINMITNAREADNLFLEKVLRDIAQPSGRLTNVYSFDSYILYTEQKQSQCHSPLQVVVSLDESTRNSLKQFSHQSSMHGSDTSGGGVWLVFLESVEEKFIENYFNGINTPFDVQLIIAELRSNEAMLLKEIYRVHTDKPLRSLNFGKWSKEIGLEVPRKSSLHYSRRSDLERITLNVGYVLSDPYTQHEEKNGQVILGGYLGDVWAILEEALNVSTNFILEPNYGSYSEQTKTWTGLVAHVNRSDFDIGIADLTLTKKRIEVISYSSPLVITTFQVFYQSAGLNIETGALFLPLATDLWLSLVGWIVVAALILYLGCYISDTNLHTYENMSLVNALFFVAGALCGQGGVNVPKTFTCRIFFIATFLITSVIIPAYSASLMSILTVVSPNIPFTDMREFFEYGKTRMMVKYSSYEYDIFSMDSSNDPYMSKIFKRDIEPAPESEFPTTNLMAIQKICNNAQNYAFFGLADAVKWAILKEEKREGRNRKCTLSNMVLNFGKISLGIAFPKNSHFRGIVNHHLSYFPSTGILKRLKHKHWPPIQPLSAPDEHQPVSLHNVVMMFAVLGFGFTASLIFLLIECILSKQRKIKTTMHQKQPKHNLWIHTVRRHGMWDSVVYYN